MLPVIPIVSIVMMVMIVEFMCRSFLTSPGWRSGLDDFQVQTPSQPASPAAIP